jgi:hypothetical protein
MNMPTAHRTDFIFQGRTLYWIEGNPGRLFVQQTYGDVEALVELMNCSRHFRFTRCPEAEVEIERLGWRTAEETAAMKPVRREA